MRCHGTLATLGKFACGIVVFSMVCITAAAHAEGERVALVIGNSAYQNTQGLANPVLDARAIADALAGVGFDSDLRLNLDRAAMSRALREFGQKADHAEVALLYYAGHGLQLPHGNGGENYLVPVDARLADARDADDEAMSLNRVLERLDGAKSRVIILDACRDNR